MGDANTDRARWLREVAALVPRPAHGGPPVLVGIDGVDGAGKTVLADELARVLAAEANVVRVSIDGFHAVRAKRYVRGKTSPAGFWLDSYDYGSFLDGVVAPFRRGDGTYLPASHDLETDAILTEPRLPVDADALVIVDGIFLHRAELAGAFDFTLLLDVPFAESVRRMSLRDGNPPDPEAPENDRYVGGQMLYFAQCDPRSAASLVIDYADLDHPRIVSPD